MNLRILLVLLSVSLFIIAVFPGDNARAQSLDEARREFMEHRIDEAFELYKVVAEGDSSPADRTEAASMAALINWHFYKKHDEGVKLLESAMAGGCEKFELLLALTLLELDRKNFTKAQSTAQRALKQAQTKYETRKAMTRYAQTIVEQHIDNARNGKIERNDKRLKKIITDLITILEDQESSLKISRLLLQAAILQGDGEAALRAWHWYFQIAPGAVAKGVLTSPQKELSEIWPAWKGMAGPKETNYRLIKYLADSRLYKEAVILGYQYNVSDDAPDAIKDILIYGKVMWDLENFIAEQYRLTFLGQTNPGATIVGFAERLYNLWNESSWPSQPCPISIPFDITDPEAVDRGMSVIKEFTDRFGLILQFRDNGAEISLGHAILEETRDIEQYGQRVRFKYILLDSMVANGSNGWATLYNQQPGGWLLDNGDGFAHVREPYADWPIHAWKLVTDPESRRKSEKAIALNTEKDWEKAAEDPYAYLPGLARRMELEAYDSLLHQLQAEGLEGDELRQEFISKAGTAQVESSIIAHEGRHLIDAHLGITYNAELEFRAKCSEVAFAQIPRMAFNSIFTSEIGRETGHGLANLRIVKGIVAWMQANADSIKGLDTSRPLLPQFDLLSDEQLREVMRSLDPLSATTVNLSQQGTELDKPMV